MAKDFLVHLNSFRIKARTEAEAKRKAVAKLYKGFTLEQSRNIIEEVEEDGEQF